MLSVDKYCPLYVSIRIFQFLAYILAYFYLIISYKNLILYEIYSYVVFYEVLPYYIRHKTNQKLLSCFNFIYCFIFWCLKSWIIHLFIPKMNSRIISGLAFSYSYLQDSLSNNLLPVWYKQSLKPKSSCDPYLYFQNQPKIWVLEHKCIFGLLNAFQ